MRLPQAAGKASRAESLVVLGDRRLVATLSFPTLKVIKMCGGKYREEN